MSRFRHRKDSAPDDDPRHAFFASMPEWDDIEDIEVDLVPEVGDLVFTLERDAVHLDSRSLGRLCTLQTWTDPLDQILRRGERRPPKGTRENPHREREPGWQLALFFEEGQVVVLEGPGTGLFDVVFKVPEAVYRDSWEALVKEAAEI